MSDEVKAAYEDIAAALQKRADVIIWEPPDSERRNYWHMNCVKFEFDRMARDIRRRIKGKPWPIT